MTYGRKLLLAAVALLFAIQINGQTTKWRDIHTVKKSETIFGIAKSYGISIQEIIDANPEMKSEGYELKAGARIFIPNSQVDGNDIGAQSANSQSSTVSATDLVKVVAKPRDGIIRVGVMLPLHNEDGDGRRMVEYYRGMLLALNQLTDEGIKTEVSAWNVPIDADIRTTLAKDGVTNLNLIFGPLYSNMVPPLANFCKAADIKLVIPYSITGDDVEKNDKIFQIYQSPADLNSKAVAAFMERFPQHHPIFIDCNDAGSDKGVFTMQVRQQLDAAKRRYNLTNVDTPLADFAKAFSSAMPNVIVINTAKSPQLNRVFQKLDSLQVTHPGLAISMFGYTEWFMYQRYNLNQFYKYSVYIPTTFYYNATSTRTEEVEKLYRDTYGVAMDPNGLPRYALTGYDQTMFFVSGLKMYGDRFVGSVDQSRWKPLQTRLNFKRVGNGGYKNENFQLVHFMPNQTMELITY